MAARKNDEPAITQDEPTRPQAVDDRGRRLDVWGLPLLGPDRLAALDGRADPDEDPTGWEPAAVDADGGSAAAPSPGQENQDG